MSADRRMNLSAEVRDALDNVTTAVERSAAFALLADRIGALPADVTLPPASVVVGLSCDDELIAEMRADFPQYCIRYAILAMTSACEEYLQRLLFIARLAALAAQRHGTTGKEFYETRDACRRETRQTSVDGLVPKILSAVRAETEAVDGLDWFRGIYSIRKCLVHRGGRIGPDDVAESQTLDVAWRKLVVELDGEPLPMLPVQVAEGQLLSVGVADERHSWRMGEAINLTPQECQHIGLSLILFCSELSTLLQRAMLPLFGVQPPE